MYIRVATQLRLRATLRVHSDELGVDGPVVVVRIMRVLDERHGSVLAEEAAGAHLVVAVAVGVGVGVGILDQIRAAGSAACVVRDGH